MGAGCPRRPPFTISSRLIALRSVCATAGRITDPEDLVEAAVEEADHGREDRPRQEDPVGHEVEEAEDEARHDEAAGAPQRPVSQGCKCRGTGAPR